eukprot:4152528-Pleurochrysis_carterae.AAC.1
MEYCWCFQISIEAVGSKRRFVISMSIGYSILAALTEERGTSTSVPKVPKEPIGATRPSAESKGRAGGAADAADSPRLVDPTPTSTFEVGRAHTAHLGDGSGRGVR